jgi:hypothetical protein
MQFKGNISICISRENCILITTTGYNVSYLTSFISKVIADPLAGTIVLSGFSPNFFCNI